MDDLTAAKIIIRCLDLTSLNDTDDDEVITDICRRAVTPYGNTAAVCIYQKFIPLALQLISQNIKIATVVNFPHGGTDFAKVEAEIAKAVKAGADEIDAVFPYRSFLDGDIQTCIDFVALARKNCGKNRPLKIILETGELKTTRNIKQAAQLCIEGGADFIKTSTGKSKISATPEAANAVLETILASKQKVGFKASGGIRTLEEAKNIWCLPMPLWDRAGSALRLSASEPARFSLICYKFLIKDNHHAATGNHSQKTQPPSPYRCRNRLFYPRRNRRNHR